jgi:YesN/AraC family two-component response regulator
MYLDSGLIVRAIEASDPMGVNRLLGDAAARMEADKGASAERFAACFSSLCMDVYRRFYSLTFFQCAREEFEFLLDCEDRIGALSGVREMAKETAKQLCRLTARLCEDENLISTAKAIIHTEPGISLSALALRLYVSDSYLSTMFRLETGQSFKEYLTQCRVDQAVKLLGENRYTVSEIGNMVGYTSEKHFFVVFKKITGLSPAKYRLSHLSGK